MSDSKIKLWLPNLDIKKAKDKDGNDLMVFEGVASTLDQDVDGEVLDPNGFDFGYFMKSGFVNWHHQQTNSPASIIGEPVEARVENNKFYVKAQLYAWSPLAREVWDLAENLKKSGSSRRLGWSIEGKKRQVDPLNKKFIKKSLITGVAITPMPKNRGTYADIVKAIDNDWETEISMVGGKSIESIIDIMKANGERIIVDKNLNINIVKNDIMKAVDEVHPSMDIKIKNLVVLQKAIELGKIPAGKIQYVRERIKASFPKI